LNLWHRPYCYFYVFPADSNLYSKLTLVREHDFQHHLLLCLWAIAFYERHPSIKRASQILFPRLQSKTIMAGQPTPT
jgi:hypothetical protein